ncbi:collagen-binding protein [Mangrovimonas yunxiaonensis]|uniref:Collagen-binding protein n=1 Tax=Mangrovimonas yunxiaonensis TaxID=1197477 RepID=A0A084TKM7_9FLAO|nr:TonB-dependent receptor [Mangrovimonas yunxiaonensis]KFB01263.1 collagen-binding protein [Mangrovimonas yunxiaonensis]GGH37733.1 collagen-binding protein [Mangrovimonas yunxiaonensis]
MKHVQIIFFLFVGLFCQAQEKFSISGTIKDLNNGETLLGATVYLKDTSFGTITNEYGFFSLTAPKGTYTLVISYVGYGAYSQNLTLDKDQNIDIELNPSSTALDEVVITAEEPEMANIRKPQMSVSKLNAKTIKEMPAVLGEVDVVKSIQLLPGVTNNGEGSAGFHVRGGAADQNLVLLDEAIIYNTSHFFGFFSVFNADAIKNINLYKGDIPAKYGGRVSSVLDVRQKDGNSKAFQLNGGVGLISSRLAAEAPLFNDKGSFLVAGRASYAHLFMPLIEDVKDDKISFYDLNLKTNYTLNQNNRLYLSGYFGRDVFNLSKIIENNYGNATGNLRWNHVFNDKLFSNLSLIYSKYDYQILLDFIELDWTADITNFNLKYDLGYYVNNNLTLDFGISGLTYNVNPGEVKPASETSAINALKLDEKRAFEGAAYASAEHEISNKLTLNYGLRYSVFSRLGGQNMTHYANNQPVVYNSDLAIYERGEAVGETYFSKSKSIKTFAHLEPRLGLSYQLNQTSSVKASYTKSTQYLHLLSNTSSATPLDVWTPSGEYIKPQISNQVALGYYKKIKDNTFALELETYYKHVDNRIDYIDGSSLIGNNNIETEILNGEARAYGLEVLVRKNKGKFTGWLAYTLSKSEQRALGGNAGGPGINNGDWYNTAYDRTHDVSLTGAYTLNDKWRFSTNFVFQTGRPVTYPNGQYTYEGLSVATYSNRNEDRLPAYHRLDISATFTPKKHESKRWKSEWVFGIYNAYNRKNAASISFNQNRETGLNEATRISIFGIIPSVTYNFKF